MLAGLQVTPPEETTHLTATIIGTDGKTVLQLTASSAGFTPDHYNPSSLTVSARCSSGGLTMLTAVPALLAEGSEAADTAVVVIGAALGLIQIILWIAAAISILRNDRFTGGGKLLWFVVIIGFPFLGCLGWFLFGRKAQLVKPGASSSTHTSPTAA